MKNFIKITLIFLGILSIPSAVFAEASWYGSLRAGIQSSGSKLSVFDGHSRWGIRGSAEAGEGLTAVYRFEHKISTQDASQPEGRLSHVGLSGSFGTVTVGQIWSASYTSVGAITDNSWFYGNSQTTYRHGHAVSYAFSNDIMRLQIDRIYMDRGSALDTFWNNNPEVDLQSTEYGLSVNIGDIGKVAIAHVDDVHKITDRDESKSITSNDTHWSFKKTTLAGEVSVSNLTAYIGTQTVKNTCLGVYVTLAACNQSDAWQKDTTERTTFFGVRGGLGDTGLNYVFQWRDVKSKKQNPWLLSLTKGLGDSASLVLEHADNDGGSANKTGVALAIGF